MSYRYSETISQNELQKVLAVVNAHPKAPYRVIADELNKMAVPFLTYELRTGGGFHQKSVPWTTDRLSQFLIAKGVSRDHSKRVRQPAQRKRKRARAQRLKKEPDTVMMPGPILQALVLNEVRRLVNARSRGSMSHTLEKIAALIVPWAPHD